MALIYHRFTVFFGDLKYADLNQVVGGSRPPPGTRNYRFIGCVTLKDASGGPSADLHRHCFGKWIVPRLRWCKPFLKHREGYGNDPVPLTSRTAEAIGVRGTRLPLS
jgi:hypothetical protein